MSILPTIAFRTKAPFTVWLVRIWVMALCTLVLVPPSLGFVRTRTSTGIPLFWNKGGSPITVFMNPTNADQLSEGEVDKILEDSIGQWRGYSSLNLKGVITYEKPKSGQNDVIFTKSPGYFSSGVLAVTAVSYKGGTGEILEADIYVNDNQHFTANALDTSGCNLSSQFYLGDVLTHELGHLQGLGHGQVRNSTMLFCASRGQYATKEDDQMGAFNIAPIATSGGTIQGKVIGSKKLYGIIGAHVQIISLNQGKVLAGYFTDENGLFSFNNLPLNDTYYLYVRPISTDSEAAVPPYFLSAQKSYCLTGDYRGSFFSKCDSRGEGYPQGIGLTSSEKIVDVGLVSIKCGLDTPSVYLNQKNYGSFQNSDFDLTMMQLNSSIGNAFVGFFNKTEITNRTLDVIKIDLTQLPVSDELFLDLKAISQDFYSKLRTSMTVYRNGVSMGSFPDLSESIDLVELDSEGNPLADSRAIVPLSLNSADNTFEIELKPIPLNADIFYSEENFLPAVNNFGDSLAFYFFMANIVKKDPSGETYSNVYKRDYKPYEDNQNCPDAPGSLSLKAFVSNIDKTTQAESSSSPAAKKDSGLLGISCGQIDDRGAGGGQGPTQFLLGFSLSFLLWVAKFKKYFSKKA